MEGGLGLGQEGELLLEGEEALTDGGESRTEVISAGGRCVATADLRLILAIVPIDTAHAHVNPHDAPGRAAARCPITARQ